MAIRRRAVASGSPQSPAPSGGASVDGIKGHPSYPVVAAPSATKVRRQEQDNISLANMLPAIAVTSLVSVGSYYSCASAELAEDVVVATIRTFMQLSLLAAMLSPLFRFVESQATNNEATGRLQRYPIILVLGYIFCFMLPIAAYEASSRSKLTLRPPDSRYLVLLIVMAALFIAVSMLGAVAIFIVKPAPWYSPRVIPLFGMLFNNALSGVSLALDVTFTELQSKQRETIELMISFGADAWSATRPSFQTVLAASLKPQINSMMTCGLVSIPGMMTGQVLGGASPTRAARYQIMIMCLILGANFVSIAIASELLIWNAFDGRGALRDDFIVENDSLRVSQVVASFSTLQKSLFRKSGSTALPSIETERSAEVVAVELSSKDAPDETAALQVALDGFFAKGRHRMTANFSLPRGLVVLQGTSGVGKSTLLKSIAELNSGLVPAQSSSKSLFLFGKDSAQYHPTEWRRDVLYLPQTGASALQGTPSSFISFVASSNVHQQHSSRHNLESLMSQTTVYLSAWGFESPQSKLSKPWSKLSGGEGQRVLLAIALATSPTVLLLDEVTSALDMKTKLAVEESIQQIAATSCVVMVTHDGDQIERLGAIVVMSMGAVQ